MIPKVLTYGSPVAMGAVLLAQESIQPPAVRMDPTLLAAAIVTVISSLGGMIVLVINSASAARDRREAAIERRALMEKTNASATKADVIIEKSDAIIKGNTEIHSMTNSTNSNLQKALELMTEKNSGLERLMQKMEQEKKETASMRVLTDLQTSTALRTAPPEGETQKPVSGDVHSTGAAESLEKIDTNTAAIEKNTARTDATVDELKTASKDKGA